MTNEKFEALVSRLEQQAQAEPERYQLKVLLLLILALLAGFVVSVMVLKALAAKLIFVVGAFFWMILKMLWVKLDTPEGTEDIARQVPELFAIINGLRRQLGAPRFHHVLMTD